MSSPTKLPNRHMYSPNPLRVRIVFAAVIFWLASWFSNVFAGPALETNFDGESLSLQMRQGSVAFQVLLHQLDKENHQFGKAAERISLRCPAGHSAPFAFPISPAPVIEEFQAEIWMLSNRPGVQLAATIVLPRSINPETGKPHQLMIRSGKLSSGASWEQLALTDVTEALASMARVARMQSKFPIDERGAFISEILILVPGGPGMSELLVDKLEIHGVLGNASEQKEGDGAASRVGSAQRSSVLQDRPRVPRIIRWQGESFEYLSRLGFQAIGMTRLPRPEELAEADRMGLFLVCPPPDPKAITSDGISADYNRVMFWDLGEQLTENDLDQLIRWQQLIKRHDIELERRTVLAPQRLTREASRIADLVLLDRQALGAGLTLSDYAAWMTQRTRLARPGTPTWCRIPTQGTPNQDIQLQTLSANPNVQAVATYRQLSSLISTGIGVRSTGFYFESRSSLAEQNPATQRRAQALELTNLRIGLMEPWLAAGKLQASARCNDPQTTALVLQAERSHLLIPISWSDQLDGVEEPRSTGPLWFVVPGVAESSEAYLLTLGGPQRLRHERVTGGIRVSLDHLPSDGLLMLSDDPTAISQVARYLRRVAPRATQLKRQLAQTQLDTAARIYSTIPEDVAAAEMLQTTLVTAKRHLSECDAAVASRNFEQAYRNADAAVTTLQSSHHMLWQKVVASRSPAELPLATSFEMLPSLLRWSRNPNHPGQSANLLPGGEFESLQVLLDSGWKHRQLEIPHVESAVRLSPVAPRAGSYCLELEAKPVDPAAPPPLLATAPVWVRSKPVRLRAGDVVEISGMVRVPAELIGSVDGLQIFDTLGGVELATRVKLAPSWQPFRMIRATASDSELRVVMALTGLGTAQVDNLAVRPLTSGTPQRLSAAQEPLPLNAR